MSYNPTAENSFIPSAENIKKAIAQHQPSAKPNEPTFANVLPPISEAEKKALEEKAFTWLFEDQ
ncbi:MAG: hypothetical protein AAFN38_21765 [Cyanobacteria bacterium J06560_5]